MEYFSFYLGDTEYINDTKKLTDITMYINTPTQEITNSAENGIPNISSIDLYVNLMDTDLLPEDIEKIKTPVGRAFIITKGDKIVFNGKIKSASVEFIKPVNPLMIKTTITVVHKSAELQDYISNLDLKKIGMTLDNFLNSVFAESKLTKLIGNTEINYTLIDNLYVNLKEMKNFAPIQLGDGVHIRYLDFDGNIQTRSAIVKRIDNRRITTPSSYFMKWGDIEEKTWADYENKKWGYFLINSQGDEEAIEFEVQGDNEGIWTISVINSKCNVTRRNDNRIEYIASLDDFKLETYYSIKRDNYKVVFSVNKVNENTNSAEFIIDYTQKRLELFPRVEMFDKAEDTISYKIGWVAKCFGVDNKVYKDKVILKETESLINEVTESLMVNKKYSDLSVVEIYDNVFENIPKDKIYSFGKVNVTEEDVNYLKSVFSSFSVNYDSGDMVNSVYFTDYSEIHRQEDYTYMNVSNPQSNMFFKTNEEVLSTSEVVSINRGEYGYKIIGNGVSSYIRTNFDPIDDGYSSILSFKVARNSLKNTTGVYSELERAGTRISSQYLNGEAISDKLDFNTYFLYLEKDKEYTVTHYLCTDPSIHVSSVNGKVISVKNPWEYGKCDIVIISKDSGFCEKFKVVNNTLHELTLDRVIDKQIPLQSKIYTISNLEPSEILEFNVAQVPEGDPSYIEIGGEVFNNLDLIKSNKIQTAYGFQLPSYNGRIVYANLNSELSDIITLTNEDGNNVRLRDEFFKPLLTQDLVYVEFYNYIEKRWFSRKVRYYDGYYLYLYEPISLGFDYAHDGKPVINMRRVFISGDASFVGKPEDDDIVEMYTIKDRNCYGFNNKIDAYAIDLLIEGNTEAWQGHVLKEGAIIGCSYNFQIKIPKHYVNQESINRYGYIEDTTSNKIGSEDELQMYILSELSRRRKPILKADLTLRAEFLDSDFDYDNVDYLQLTLPEFGSRTKLFKIDSKVRKINNHISREDDYEYIYSLEEINKVEVV